MRIDKNESIAGQRILRIRDYLRRVGPPRMFRKGNVVEYFNVSDRKAAEILRELKVHGLIERAQGRDGQHGFYELTMRGNALTSANAIPPITRAKAEQLLSDFLKRVAEVNRREELTHRIAEVRVFGSYLNKKAKDLGDIDLAIDMRVREIPGRDLIEYSQKRALHAVQSGRRFRTGLEMMFYGEIEVRRLLRARSPYISIHPLTDIKVTGSKSRLIYKAKS
jgi:predicted nucleotidyltransferase